MIQSNASNNQPNETNYAALLIMQAEQLIKSQGGKVVWNTVLADNELSTAPKRIEWRITAPYHARLEALATRLGEQDIFVAPVWCTEKQIHDYLIAVRRHANKYKGMFTMVQTSNSLLVVRD